MFSVKAHENKTINWWYARRNEIDFDPVYQRKGNVWSEYDQAFLIDSIINAYDIPKIYLADFSYGNNILNPQKMTYAVIDGKQRLKAIFRFFNNEVALNSDFSYQKDPSIKLAGLVYKDIKSKYGDIADMFDTFNLAVISVITDEAGKIEDLFVRLNRSKSLTGAELRSAMGGPIPVLIEELVKHPLFQEKIAFSTKRKNEYNAAVKLLYIEEQESLQNTKKAILDKYTLSKKKANVEDLMGVYNRCVDSLNKMYEVFVKQDKVLSSAGLLVLYYWFIRNSPQNSLKEIRPFLATLNNMRKDPEKCRDHNAKQEMLKFNLAIRSINDQSTLTAAYNAMQQLFTLYLENKLQ